VNEVQLSGTITQGPRFTQPDGRLIGTFVLDAGQGDGIIRAIPVVALGRFAEQLQEFNEGDTIKVVGPLYWREQGIEIMATGFKQHHEGAYRQNRVESIQHHALKLNLGKAPKRHW
jgi:hypothetical protein